MRSCPNILLITSDQQRTDSLGCYGSEWMQTPHLDRLAREGVLCYRAYCTNPVCTPSRASILSGQKVSRHGAWNVGTVIPDDVLLLSHLLGAHRYRTHSIGKTHFQPYMAPPEQSVETLTDWPARFPDFSGPYYGFQSIELAMGHTTFGLAGHYGAWVRSQVSAEEFENFSRANRHGAYDFGANAFDWDLPHALHNSVWTANRTIDFLERCGPEPFVLNVGFQDPHAPHALPRDYPHRLQAEDVPLLDFTPGELEDKPPHFSEVHRGEFEQSAWRGDYPMAGQGSNAGPDYRRVATHDGCQGRAYYYNMVELMDAQIGRILHTLDATGQAQNTLVIFTSDHGDLLGDHGLWQKGAFHYEQLIKVPLLMRWPRAFAGGQSMDSLVSLCDLAPTVLAACDAEIPAAMNGVSALPLLRGEVESIREHCLVEFVDDPRGLRLRTLVTPTRKLTHYAGAECGELYDLENDPGENINRWRDADYAADKSTLMGRLLDETESLERREPRLSYA